MQTLVIATCCLCVINLLVNIAIAGSIAKIVVYLRGEPSDVEVSKETSNLPIGPLYRMVDGELVDISNSLDLDVLRGRAEPYSDGVGMRPATKNWDGVSD
jgi:hypothetical protein